MGHCRSALEVGLARLGRLQAAKIKLQSDGGGGFDGFEDGEDGVDFGRWEEAVDAFGAEVDEGGGVEEFGVEEAAVGDMVDEQVEELDLVSGGGAAGEELVEGGFGDGAVEAGEGAEEEAEAVTNFAGVGEVAFGADAFGDEEAFDLLEVSDGEGFEGAEFVEDGNGFVVAQKLAGFVLEAREVEAGRELGEFDFAGWVEFVLKVSEDGVAGYLFDELDEGAEVFADAFENGRSDVLPEGFGLQLFDERHLGAHHRNVGFFG